MRSIPWYAFPNGNRHVANKHVKSQRLLQNHMSQADPSLADQTSGSNQPLTENTQGQGEAC